MFWNPNKEFRCACGNVVCEAQIKQEERKKGGKEWKLHLRRVVPKLNGTIQKNGSKDPHKWTFTCSECQKKQAKEEKMEDKKIDFKTLSLEQIKGMHIGEILTTTTATREEASQYLENNELAVCDKCGQVESTYDLNWITSDDFTPKEGEKLPDITRQRYDALCERCYKEELEE